jgi:hypothetical protein
MKDDLEMVNKTGACRPGKRARLHGQFHKLEHASWRREK